jgi:protein involved in polysaccharide export with SLBB domain
MLLASLATGCAAITNPTADGIPVRLVPSELLAKPKNGEVTIPLTALGKPYPTDYRLARQDILAVYVEGVHIASEQSEKVPPPAVPVQVPQFDKVKINPTFGYPIPVRDDGTIDLPLVKPVRVHGLNIEETQELIRNVYKDAGILKPGKDRVQVALLRPRIYQVMVFRQEYSAFVVDIYGSRRGSSKRGTGYVVELSALENDVLHALAQSGGLPSVDALNDIYIERNGYIANPFARSPLAEGDGVTKASRKIMDNIPPDYHPPDQADPNRPIIRIPLRAKPGEPPHFRPEDVVLGHGDVVFIEARDVEHFYVGGLLPPGDHVLPRDSDLDVVEAVARVRGPFLNGGQLPANITNISGTLVAAGLGGPSPSLLSVVRRTPNGGQVNIRVDLNRAMRDPRERLLVQTGDVLILQESPGEAIGRYFSEQFKFNYLHRITPSTTVTGVVP